MFISDLKLHGFKSFAQKENLSFGEGITAVVGPNGCGKTNIVDAIRWVLGEQKYSILRSSRMVYVRSLLRSITIKVNSQLNIMM